MYNEPLSPALDVPVLKIIMPLTPLTPAFDDCNNNTPLDVTVLYPLNNEIWPPDKDDETPADKYNSPPTPLSPLPTTT
jgi:hypothetical protein